MVIGKKHYRRSRTYKLLYTRYKSQTSYAYTSYAISNDTDQMERQRTRDSSEIFGAYVISTINPHADFRE